MKIDLKIVFSIIFISSLLGLAYNYFSPKGIPIFPEEKTLKWASDSLFNTTIKDSIEIKDTLNKRREQIEEETEVREKTIKNEVEKEAVKKDVQTEPLSINLKQAYSLYKKNTLFIDAREPEDYRLAHIKNAINLPMDHFDDYKYMLEKIDKDQPIVTYCAGTDCDLRIVLSNVLYDMGYKKLYIFFGGWNEWLNAKYPTETSESKE